MYLYIDLKKVIQNIIRNINIGSNIERIKYYKNVKINFNDDTNEIEIVNNNIDSREYKNYEYYIGEDYIIKVKGRIPEELAFILNSKISKVDEDTFKKYKQLWELR